MSSRSWLMTHHRESLCHVVRDAWLIMVTHYSDSLCQVDHDSWLIIGNHYVTWFVTHDSLYESNSFPSAGVGSCRRTRRSVFCNSTYHYGLSFRITSHTLCCLCAISMLSRTALPLPIHRRCHMFMCIYVYIYCVYVYICIHVLCNV